MEYRAAKEVLSLILSVLLFPHSVFFVSPGVRRRMRRQRLVTQEDVRVCKDNRLSSRPHGVTFEVAREHAFAECSKGCAYIYTPSLLLAYHALYSVGYNNRIQNGPHDCCGPAKAPASKAKPVSRVSAGQSEQSDGQCDRKGGKQLAHPGPHRGDSTSSNFVSESRSEGFLHAPPCGLASTHPGFPARDYPGKSRVITWPGFAQGGH
jgi:hypothetical protein